MSTIALAAWLIPFLAAYNNVLTLARLTASVQVPLNLTAAGVALVAARLSGLSWEALGLAPSSAVAGAAWGGLLAAGIAVVLATLMSIGATRSLLTDRRHERLAGRGLAAATLLRIPLGTSVPEEVLFRGVLLAALTAHWGVPAAVLASSVVFGVWHVVPAMRLLEAKGIGGGRVKRVSIVAGVVVATASAGAAFSVLRLASGSLLAPVLVHAAINSLSATGAALEARRRVRSDPIEVIPVRYPASRST